MNTWEIYKVLLVLVVVAVVGNSSNVKALNVDWCCILTLGFSRCCKSKCCSGSNEAEAVTADGTNNSTTQENKQTTGGGGTTGSKQGIDLDTSQSGDGKKYGFHTEDTGVIRTYSFIAKPEYSFKSVKYKDTEIWKPTDSVLAKAVLAKISRDSSHVAIILTNDKCVVYTTDDKLSTFTKDDKEYTLDKLKNELNLPTELLDKNKENQGKGGTDPDNKTGTDPTTKTSGGGTPTTPSGTTPAS